MFPFAADVGEDAGDVFIGELRQSRHGEVVGAAADFHGAGEAVHDDAGEHLGLAEHPFAIDERRREAVETEAVRLMAGGAEGGVDGFAFFKERGLRLGEWFDDGRGRGTGFAGPDEAIREAGGQLELLQRLGLFVEPHELPGFRCGFGF